MLKTTKQTLQSKADFPQNNYVYFSDLMPCLSILRPSCISQKNVGIYSYLKITPASTPIEMSLELR